MYKILFIILNALCIGATAQVGGVTEYSTRFSTIEGSRYSLIDSGQVYVIVFLSPSCPLSQKYTLTFNDLTKAYDDTVKFYGVFAETGAMDNEYVTFQKRFSIQFPLLIDKKKRFAKKLGASVTPECFVISNRRVLYHGAIDDWVVELGKTKPKPSTSFVSQAIKCAMEKKVMVPAYVKPVGCYID